MCIAGLLLLRTLVRRQASANSRLAVAFLHCRGLYAGIHKIFFSCGRLEYGAGVRTSSKLVILAARSRACLGRSVHYDQPTYNELGTVVPWSDALKQICNPKPSRL